MSSQSNTLKVREHHNTYNNMINDLERLIPLTKEKLEMAKSTATSQDNQYVHQHQYLLQIQRVL